MTSLRRELSAMTPLARAVMEDVRKHGPSTAAQIATRIGRNARSVRTSCLYLRGERWLDDGATSTRINNTDGSLAGFAHTAAPSPIRWRFIPQDEVVKNIETGRWSP